MQYNRFVKPSYDEFIKPVMKYADIIIPHGRSNTVAIDFVLLNLKQQLKNLDTSAKIQIRKESLKDSSTPSSPNERQDIPSDNVNIVQPLEEKI
jgi:uridine kinase